MSRKIADCRDFPSESQCTLTLAGEEDEVLKAATEHAVSVHGHQDSPQLRSEIRSMLKAEMEMSSMESCTKNFKNPEEIRPFKAHGHLDLLSFKDGSTVGRGNFQPGWKWSNDVKPIAGTPSCEAPHLGYCLSGEMTIRMNDGNEFQIREGDTFEIAPGHDAWVSGSQPCVLLDFTGYENYAKSMSQQKAA